MNMVFMDFVVQICELCYGLWYNEMVFSYVYQGKMIVDVFQMLVIVVLVFFVMMDKVVQLLKNLDWVGLGYLILV